MLQLSQPFVLDSMRLLLWDDDDRIYSYEINVSTDLVKWKTIARKRNESSWQNIKFEPIPVVFVRIMGISSSANNVRLIEDVFRQNAISYLKILCGFNTLLFRGSMLFILSAQRRQPHRKSKPTRSKSMNKFLPLNCIQDNLIFIKT